MGIPEKGILLQIAYNLISAYGLGNEREIFMGQ